MSDIQKLGKLISRLNTEAQESAACLYKMANELKKVDGNIGYLLKGTSRHCYQDIINQMSMAEIKLKNAADSLLNASECGTCWLEQHVGGMSKVGYSRGDGGSNPVPSISSDEDDIKSIDKQIDSCREALFSRGVPDCKWLDNTLADYRETLLEKRKSDSLNIDNNECTCENTSFFDDLACRFRSYCVETTNPNYREEKIDKWHINCQRCVPTYELLRRGMNITAMPCEAGYDYLSAFPFSVWEQPQIISCSGNDLSEIESTMSAWGDGARAQVVVMWTETEGHTFIAEQIEGVTHFIDPQSANDAYDEWSYSAIPGKTLFCRIDNLEFSEIIRNCYKETNY